MRGAFDSTEKTKGVKYWKYIKMNEDLSRMINSPVEERLKFPK